MASITSSLTSYVFGLVTSDYGFSNDSQSVFIQNASPEITERSQTVRYPAIYVYCEKLTNNMKEKFGVFSGSGRLVIEVRCSQDRIDGMQNDLERYTDAVCRVLDNARGSWQDGAFYSGGYEVSFSSLKQGGRNFLQTAKISFDVEISR